MAYPTNELTGASNLVELTLAIRNTIGQTAQLTTKDKANLVAAINELVTTVNGIRTDLQNKTEINDAASTATNVWSALKTSTEISNAATKVKNDLLNGAGEAYDTLKELGALIDANKGTIEALQAIAAGHVKFDGAQSLTPVQQKQARDNIGAGSKDEVAQAKKAGTDAQASLDAFKSAVGDPHIDLKKIFESGVAE